MRDIQEAIAGFMNKKAYSFVTLITALILCVCSSFASFAETPETTAAQNTAGSIAEAVQGALSDSGISDTVDSVIGDIQANGGLSDVVGGISDRISGSLSGYSSILDGVINGSANSQTTAPAQVTQTYGNFALPDSPVQNNNANRVTSAQTTVPETTAPPETTLPQTTAVSPTTVPAPEATAALTVKNNDSRGSGIWIFIAAAAAVILVAVVTLIAVTGHTEFNSRVYDRSTIKSVRKSSASAVEFDDDEPMDNIMYVGTSDKDKRESRG